MSLGRLLREHAANLRQHQLTGFACDWKDVVTRNVRVHFCTAPVGHLIQTCQLAVFLSAVYCLLFAVSLQMEALCCMANGARWHAHLQTMLVAIQLQPAVHAFDLPESECARRKIAIAMQGVLMSSCFFPVKYMPKEILTLWVNQHECQMHHHACPWTGQM